MRKAQKKEILDFIKSLYQAHEEIVEALQRGKIETMQNMLGECQEFALVLGNTIEEKEGEGHVTASYIGEYCEMLFRIYDNISNGKIHENKIAKTLKRNLMKIENSIKNDINVRKEIVFFPYKASMWDSLESIYLAAKEDLDCDAYCVPIPYYDLNPDNSFGQIHYEGGEYPENIEITDWQAYLFEERKPDVIYIHNAYDNWNLVTSVHPRFYSKNLKQYTEKLVYVPYFVLGKISPENTGAIEKMRHFCFLPGIIHADSVIVESEDVKKIYVNEYLRAAKENGLGGWHLDRRYLEKKILGLGSPKYDRIAGIRKDEVKIPEKWAGIIVGSDGSRKKVILYNTSIAMLLQHNEKMLGKIENTFHVLKKNSGNVAVLWRPHPLMESAMASMRPQIGKAYAEIVGKYVKEGWGIYDDTADFDRALAISDAYYGDNSSVVQVYKQTGKPIVLQSVHHFTENCYAPKWLFSCLKTVGGKTFAFSRRNNGLFLLDEEGKAEFIASIPREKMWIKNLYIDMVQWKDFLFLIPGRAEAIAKVHTATYEIEKIEMDLVDGWNPDNAKFVGAVIWKQELVLLPEKYPAIVHMNLCMENFSYVTLPVSEFCFKKGYYCDGERIYLPSSVACFVLKYSLPDNRMEKIVIPECGQGVWSLTESDGLKYLVSFPDSDVIWWDEENNQFGIMENEIPEYSSDGYGSSVIVHCKEKLVVFPIKGNYVLEVDKKKKSVKECTIDWKYEKGKLLAYVTKNQNLLYFYQFEEKKGLFGDTNVELLEVNADTLTLRRREYKMKDISYILQASGETIFYERYGIELTEYIEFVKRCTQYTKNVITELCGRRIHREMTDEKM